MALILLSTLFAISLSIAFNFPMNCVLDYSANKETAQTEITSATLFTQRVIIYPPEIYYERNLVIQRKVIFSSQDWLSWKRNEQGNGLSNVGKCAARKETL